MENGTWSPLCQSHYLRLNAIMRSMTKRCSLSFEPYKSGGTSLKALNTSSRYGRTTKTSSTSWCKGNCSLKKHLKCRMHLRASKSTSRGSKDVQLHNNELKYITYLVGDLKRKE